VLLGASAEGLVDRIADPRDSRVNVHIGLDSHGTAQSPLLLLFAGELATVLFVAHEHRLWFAAAGYNNWPPGTVNVAQERAEFLSCLTDVDFRNFHV